MVFIRFKSIYLLIFYLEYLSTPEKYLITGKKVINFYLQYIFFSTFTKLWQLYILIMKKLKIKRLKTKTEKSLKSSIFKRLS